MFNGRQHIAQLMLGVCDNVKMTKPDGDVELPLVCYAETVNRYLNNMYDTIGYRIVCYANTFDEVVEMSEKVNEAMDSIGFLRTSKSSDDEAHRGTDLYMIRLDYTATVNRYTGGVARNLWYKP